MNSDVDQILRGIEKCLECANPVCLRKMALGIEMEIYATEAKLHDAGYWLNPDEPDAN
jgi:hypothetical protein